MVVAHERVMNIIKCALVMCALPMFYTILCQKDAQEQLS